MPSLPVEILLGIYLGLLTGIFPALISGGLGFIFKYFTGVTLPGLGVVVLAVAVAGVNGGLLGLIDPTIKQSPRLLVAVTVVMMLALYAHSQGDKLGASLPKRFSLRTLRRRTLSMDVVDFVGGIGQVTIEPAGQVGDMEGYPPLPADVRTAIEAGSWKFPADVPLDELERRLADRLRSEYDLADAAATIDSHGRASVSAAPPSGGLSRRVPAGHRAVSVNALVPTGIARGEKVRILTDGGTVSGAVLSAKSDPDADPPGPAVATDGGERSDGPRPSSERRSDGGEGRRPELRHERLRSDGGAEEPAEIPVPTAAPTTAGGEGRVTVAVPGERAGTLLEASRGRVVVLSRGTRREYELVSLFRRTGKRIKRLTVGSAAGSDGTRLDATTLRTDHGVAVLAVNRNESVDGDPDGGWEFSPAGAPPLTPGDEVFVAGSADAVERFREAVH